VEVTADDVDLDNKDLVIGNGVSVIRPINNVDEIDGDDEKASLLASMFEKNKLYSYITVQGQQTMALSPGGWTLEFPPSTSGSTARNKNKGKASKLRFWMDLLTDIERNDIKIKAGTRLYFAANCWREEDYDIGVAKFRPIQQQAEEAQRMVEQRLSHDTGDRRLDGVDALETIQAYGDMAKLVLDRDQKLEKLLQAKRVYPSALEDNLHLLPEGPWPGSNEWLTLAEDMYNPIFVVKDKGLLMGKEYQVVGTWTGQAILSDDEYEDDFHSI
jgi:hypothetical protein